MNTCMNCRGTFDPEESSSLDPTQFCGSECELQYWGEGVTLSAHTTEETR